MGRESLGIICTEREGTEFLYSKSSTLRPQWDDNPDLLRYVWVQFPNSAPALLPPVGGSPHSHSQHRSTARQCYTMLKKK